MASVDCFVSYSWDSEEHKRWVLRVAEQLHENGVYVHLDQWDVEFGTDLPKYMETKVRDCHHVLLVCTPSFAEKANSGRGGVGYEKTIITGEIFAGIPRDTKFIPILRSGDHHSSIPSYLQSKAFVDMRDDSVFDEKVNELLRQLHGSRSVVRPPLGKAPEFKKPISQTPAKFDMEKFKKLRDYAYFTDGLNLSESAAVKWAEARLKDGDSFDLAKFKELRDYAYLTDGLNLDPADAVKWAEDRLRDGDTFDLEGFRKLRDYAYSTDGLNLDAADAVAWAIRHLTDDPSTIDEFRKLRDYAYSADGLNLDAADATEWAEARIREG